MFKRVALLTVLALLFSGCSGSGPKAKIASAKYAESINSGGVSMKYEGQDIVQIVLNFTFDKSLVSDSDPASEDYRKEVFALLAPGAHFYYAGQEVERTFGYWPKEAGSDHAKELSLFYLVPSNHSAESMRFVYDGQVLGEGGSGIDTTVKPD